MKAHASTTDSLRVWLDVTTSWRARGGQTNGTLRVERSYAAALAPLLGERLHYLRYDHRRLRYLPLAGIPQLAEASGPGPPSSRRERALGVPDTQLSAGRRLERRIRSLRRAAVSLILDKFGGERDDLAGAQPGDILLMAGENWAHHDFDALRALRNKSGLRLAVLCQDMIPEVCPQFFAGSEFVAQYRAYADFLVRDADLVIAISQSTRADILAYAESRGGMAGRVATVQLGADLPAASAPAPPPPLESAAPGSFVISVSTIQSRKNFDLLYRLWQRMSRERVPGLPKLVIVGRRGFGSTDLLWQIENDPLVRDSITVLHQASDPELVWLYRNCLFTLYPSFYEGWGLPVTESLSFGKYCLASNTSSMPEAGQGLVLHLDPLDFPAWRAAVMTLIADREELRARERRIATEYRPVTWADSARALVAELQRLRLPAHEMDATPSATGTGR